jgi:hypothetical protein
MHNQLTPNDRERYQIIRACTEGESTNAEAAAKLRLTVRQVRRLKRKIEKEKASGILHGNRGKRSNRAIAAETRQTVITFMKEAKHRDFGPTFAQEQLLKQKRIVLSVETVRSILIKENLWKPKQRRTPGIHREWRERMAMQGELVQFDGSYHDWFENGTEACLLAAIDDATSGVEALFEDNEGVYAVFRFWWRYVEHHGRPVAIYLDKFSTYKINHQSAVDNAELMTQFERAMQELTIRVICANSPEAKGRIERLFGTLQDRLVKELRLSGIADRNRANEFLEKTYVPEHNARFSVEPKTQGDAHRPLTEELQVRLPSIFSVHSERRVNNDYTIRFKSVWYQLKATTGVAIFKGDTVTLEERLDGSVHIRLRTTYLTYEVLPERPRPAKTPAVALVKKSTAHTPSPDHPWRKTAARAAKDKKQHHTF